MVISKEPKITSFQLFGQVFLQEGGFSLLLILPIVVSFFLSGTFL